MESATGGIAFALHHSTLEGRITLVSLLIFSLVSWTVIINKFRQLRRVRKRSEAFFQRYTAGSSVLDIFQQKAAFDGAPVYDVYLEGCEELDRQRTRYRGRLPLHGLSAVRIALERAMAGASVTLESGMIVLATAISGGPFVGLLGTVWGVMDTFSGIAAAQQATLTAMAPGVSAALINTIVGLLVAIPSLFCYNYLVTKIREITIEIDNFAAHLDNVFAVEFGAGGAGGGLGDAPVIDRAEAAESEQREAYPMTGSPHPGTV